MQLIDLVRKLVDNPDEREAFKANPDTYIKLQEEKLQPSLQALRSMPAGTSDEFGTVFHIRTKTTDPFIPPINATDEPVDLSGLEVIMKSNGPFFAEYKNKQAHTYTCMLLQHSYISMEPPYAMLLNLCFVDPEDKQDHPQILTIQTKYQLTGEIHYNLSNTVAYIDVQSGQYILLRGNPGFTCKLDLKSMYDPKGKALYLAFNNPPEGTS